MKDSISLPSQLREQVFRHLIEGAVGYAIMMLDMDGRVVSWNTGAQQLLGYGEEEMLGQQAAIFYSDEDKAAGIPRLEMERAREAGQADADRWHVRKDGTRFFGAGMTFPVKDDGGQGFVKIFRDATA